MNIFFIANSSFPYGNANSVNVFRMIHAFFKQGINIYLLAKKTSLKSKERTWNETCQRYGDKNKIKACFVWWPFKRGSEIALTLISVLRTIFLDKNTIIYTRVRYVAYMASFFKFKIIFESHQPPLSKFQKKLESRLFKKLTIYVIVISQKLKDIYGQMGFDSTKIHHFPDAGRQLCYTIPQMESFNKKPVHIGYIGSLYKGRGFEIIVELAKKFPSKIFHVIGDLSPLKSQDNELPNNIRLYDGVTPHQAELMTQLFDVLLLPYQNKVEVGNGLDTSQWMSPLKMFEYLHSGKPIISSDISVLREVLKHSHNCLLVPPHDVDQWDQALNKLEDPQLRYQLAFQAYQDASTLYTWDIRVQKILNLIAPRTP